MHLLDPVVQRIDDEPAHHVVVGVHGVAATGVVDVAAVGCEGVVDVVGETAVAEGGALVVPLGGMVVDHVEDHLDPGLVQRLHHVPELVQRAERFLVGAEGGMGGEEGDGAVSPVVAKTEGGVVRVELENRQQLHRRDPEVLQVRDLVDQSGIGAALVGGNSR